MYFVKLQLVQFCYMSLMVKLRGAGMRILIRLLCRKIMNDKLKYDRSRIEDKIMELIFGDLGIYKINVKELRRKMSRP